ncbi:hypothetical protein ACO2Q7_01195 [Rathayibacter sp. KR2-224]|uniref:hypothetical protein n=1 Tax=Rathayibacter sp. KR2-224 TaxID=3400913 RepID=UPI003C00DE57
MSSSASQRGVTGGRATASAVAGVIIAALLWYFGVDLGFACAVGVLAVAIGLAWAAYSGPSAVRWPLERPAPRPGARSDVARLAWAFQMHRGSVREPAFKAVRELAVLRLARFGLDLSSAGDRASVVALIGEQAYAALNPASGILPSSQQLQLCLDTLDRLPKSHTISSAPTIAPITAEPKGRDRT